MCWDNKVSSKAGTAAKLNSAAYAGTRLCGVSMRHCAEAAMVLLDLPLWSMHCFSGKGHGVMPSEDEKCPRVKHCNQACWYMATTTVTSMIIQCWRKQNQEFRTKTFLQYVPYRPNRHKLPSKLGGLGERIGMLPWNFRIGSKTCLCLYDNLLFLQ